MHQFKMREFNITGVCVSKMHYMVDTSDKLDKITKMIDEEEYFVINRPRQYGKTTTLSLLRRTLSDTYVIISISLEGLGELPYSSEQSFVETIFRQIENSLITDNSNSKIVEEWQRDPPESMMQLGYKITSFVSSLDKDVILMIDEVDESMGSRFFLDFLGLLRAKYLARNEGRDKTFKSVILAGVSDVSHLRSYEYHETHSPWNIASPFEVDMSFSPEEISTMLIQYENDHHTGMDIKEISEKIHYFTNGYPFLVSYICKTIDEKLEKDWSVEGIEKAVKIFMKSTTTLTYSLIKNLENNEDVYQMVYSILVELDSYRFVRSSHPIKKGLMYGIISESNDIVKISNKIFEIYIYDHLISEIELSNFNKSEMHGKYVSGNKLKLDEVLEGFKNFMYSEYRDKDSAFIEREGRLIFLAYLMPIINGAGFYAVESEVRNDKRMDILITHNKEFYIIELKIWHGESKHEEAYAQLADYLDIKNKDTGYLLTFSFNKDKKSCCEWIEYNGKKIFDAVI